jgi:hypothetical protein
MALYLEYLIIIVSFISVLSFLSCMLIIFMYIMSKKLNTFVMELIFHLAISEICNSISKFLSIYKIYNYDSIIDGLKDESSPMCIIQKLLINFSDTCSFILILIFSFCLNYIMAKINKDLKKFTTVFRIIIYLVPGIISPM